MTKSDNHPTSTEKTLANTATGIVLTFFQTLKAIFTLVFTIIAALAG